MVRRTNFTCYRRISYLLILRWNFSVAALSISTVFGVARSRHNFHSNANESMNGFLCDQSVCCTVAHECGAEICAGESLASTAKYSIVRSREIERMLSVFLIARLLERRKSQFGSSKSNIPRIIPQKDENAKKSRQNVLSNDFQIIDFRPGRALPWKCNSRREIRGKKSIDFYLILFRLADVGKTDDSWTTHIN